MGAAHPLRRLVGPPRAVRGHLLARTALLECLSGDPRVLAAFTEACGAAFDLAFALGALGEGLAHRAGLAGRADLFSPVGRTVSVHPEYQRLNAQYTDAVAAALPALEPPLLALVYDTWRLPWPWLVWELRELCTRLLNSLVTGDGWRGSFGAPRQPAPPPRAGETLEAYLGRVRPATSDRTGIRVNEGRIARDVRVLYRLRLKDPPDSVRAVTRSDGFTSPSNTKRAEDRAVALLSQTVPRLPRH